MDRECAGTKGKTGAELEAEGRTARTRRDGRKGAEEQEEAEELRLG